jgi:hypothetical protein
MMWFGYFFVALRGLEIRQPFCNFNFNRGNLLLSHTSHTHLTNMQSLLEIASRVEAAVASYKSVMPVTDVEEWRRRFDQEKVSAVFRCP